MFIYSYFNFYVFLLSCMFYSVYSVPLCCSVYCFMCKCVLYYCHQLTTQLQLTHISYHICVLSLHESSGHLKSKINERSIQEKIFGNLFLFLSIYNMIFLFL